MPYFALPNFKHDSGPNRIQSGPDHQGYTVLFSGVQSTGVDEGIVLYASPLSGTLLTKAWDFDSNWRYIPSTLPSQSISLDPTPYDASGVLDTYRAARIYTRDNVAGAQAASVIGPETGKITPRGGALQAGANVGRPETYMYYGGGAPDNQNYSPYNTPDANTAAEGKTGGGVTHRNYESSLLTNLLGSQGTSDRSQWRYHQPVYCKTFTETQRSATPGLMSSTLRYIYRGSATSYAYNYGGELLANKGGFELLPYESFGQPPPDPTPIGPMGGLPAFPGGTLTPPAGICAGATIIRVIGNIGDEANAVVEEVEDYTIPLTPPESLGGDTYSGKFISFRFRCPGGEEQIADTLTASDGTWADAVGQEIDLGTATTVVISWGYEATRTIYWCISGEVDSITNYSNTGTDTITAKRFTITVVGGGTTTKPCGVQSLVRTLPYRLQYVTATDTILNYNGGAIGTGGGFVNSQYGVMESTATISFATSGGVPIPPPMIIS